MFEEMVSRVVPICIMIVILLTSIIVPAITLLDENNDGSGNYNDVYKMGDYVYAVDVNNGLLAYSFSGGTFSLLDSDDQGGNYQGVYGDGTYIYVTTNQKLFAYTFNGVALSKTAEVSVTEGRAGLYHDGTYVHIGNQTGALAYTFNGAAFTLVNYTEIGSGSSTGVLDIHGNATHLFMANQGAGLRAVYFDGTSYSINSTKDEGFSFGSFYQGGRVYSACGPSGIYAYSFNGTAFGDKCNIDNGGGYTGVYADSDYVYACIDNNPGNGGTLRVYTCNGLSFSLQDTYNEDTANNNYMSAWGDTKYVYVAGSDGAGGILAFQHTSFHTMENDRAWKRYYGNSSYNGTMPFITPHFLNTTLTTPSGDSLSMYMYTNASGSWKLVNESTGLGNGTIGFTNTSWIDTWNTKYFLRYNSTNSTNWVNRSYYFLTRSLPEFDNETATPSTGTENETRFHFNVSIHDDDNDTQQVYVNVTRGSWFVNNSMDYVTGSGFNNTCANYTNYTTLPTTGTYTYTFLSWDGYFWNSSVGGTVTVSSNASFQLNFPTFLEVGDYIISLGAIRKRDGTYLNHSYVWTKIVDSSDWSTVTNSQLKQYVIYGDYSYTFSTSTMTPGVYHIIVNFTSGSTNFLTNWTLYLSDYEGPGHYATAAYFSFYNSNTGVGLDAKSFKIYADNEVPLSADDRIYLDFYPNTYTGETIYYRVDDYFGNQVYPLTGNNVSVAITNVNQHIDVPITWFDVAIKNLNETLMKFSMKNGTTYYNVTLFPMDSFHFNVLEGDYIIRKDYYASYGDNGTVIKTRWDNISVTADTYYIASGYTAHMYFSLYNTNTGLGVPWETLRFYVDDELLDDRWYHGHINETVNLVVKDYYNFTMYNGNLTIDETYTFIELGLTWHSYLFGNNDDNYYMISFQRSGSTRWFERGIMPYSEREFLLPSGTYQLRVYDDIATHYKNSSVSIISSKVLIINGSTLVTVLAGQDEIHDDLLELIDDVAPDIIKVGTNMPYVLTVYECVGNGFCWNITKVCPPQVLIGTTFNESYVNTTSYPLIPKNDSTNGTISTIYDKIWFHGGTVTWVNLTWNSNNTEIQNTTYIPNFYDIKTHRTTIDVNASHNISYIRETRYRAIKDFDWTKYTDTSKYEATVNYDNLNDVTIYDVYLYAAFADDEDPDFSTVTVYDDSNEAYLDYGEDFEVTAVGVQMSLDSMAPNETRSFTIIYYAQEDVVQPSTAMVSVDTYDLETEHDGENYHYLEFQWTNDRAETFKGPLYVDFNFSVYPKRFLRSSVDLWDDNNMKYLGRDQYTFDESGIVISQEAMRNVNRQTTRVFKFYYQYESGSITKLPSSNILASEWVGPIQWIHVINFVLILFGVVWYLVSQRPNFKERLVGLFVALILVFLVTMSYFL